MTKNINLVLIFLILTSCGGFKLKKTEVDEFLVEKKSPLVMPPNYEELPRPKDFQLSEESKKDDEFKKVINNTKKITTKKTTKKSSLEKSIIEKIN